MNKRIDEIRERCNKATYAQWKRHEVADYSEIHSEVLHFDGSTPIALVKNVEDAEFIAHSRTDIPFLLNLLEEKEKELENLQSKNAKYIQELEIVYSIADNMANGIPGAIDGYIEWKNAGHTVYEEDDI